MGEPSWLKIAGQRLLGACEGSNGVLNTQSRFRILLEFWYTIENKLQSLDQLLVLIRSADKLQANRCIAVEFRIIFSHQSQLILLMVRCGSVV